MKIRKDYCAYLVVCGSIPVLSFFYGGKQYNTLPLNDIPSGVLLTVLMGAGMILVGLLPGCFEPKDK